MLLRFGLVRIVEREPELAELRLVDLEDLVERLVVVELVRVVAARALQLVIPQPSRSSRASSACSSGPGFSLRLGLMTRSSRSWNR